MSFARWLGDILLVLSRECSNEKLLIIKISSCPKSLIIIYVVANNFFNYLSSIMVSYQLTTFIIVALTKFGGPGL